MEDPELSRKARLEEDIVRTAQRWAETDSHRSAIEYFCNRYGLQSNRLSVLICCGRGSLKDFLLSTRGPGEANLWCTSCAARRSAG